MFLFPFVLLIVIVVAAFNKLEKMLQEASKHSPISLFFILFAVLSLWWCFHWYLCCYTSGRTRWHWREGLSWTSCKSKSVSLKTYVIHKAEWCLLGPTFDHDCVRLFCPPGCPREPGGKRREGRARWSWLTGKRKRERDPSDSDLNLNRCYPGLKWGLCCRVNLGRTESLESWEGR